MLEPKKSDIGKRVICGIYIPGEKAYGKIVSFTATKISVETDPYGKVVEYDYEDVDMDFQPGDGFKTDMKEQMDKFNGIHSTHMDEVVEVDVVEVQTGAEPNVGFVCQTIQVKDGI